MRFHVGFSFSFKTIKKYIIPILAFLLAIFGINYFSMIDVHAESGTYQQKFTTDDYQYSELTVVNQLGTYNVSQGIKFYAYYMEFTDTSIQKGKTYHAKYDLFGSISDGFYSLASMNFKFYSYETDGIKELPVYNLKMTGSGTSRSIEFDFLNVYDGKTFSLRTTGFGGSGTMYYSWSSDSQFGWTQFTLTKASDQDDALIKQNEIIINQNQQTNEKLTDINQSILGSSSAITDKITDSSIDPGTGNDFFDNFEYSDNGGISSIVTAPLTLINSLLDSYNSCQALTIPILGKNVEIPSGCILWNEVPSNVETIIQTIVYGVGAYFLLRKLFKDIDNLKDPNKSEVSTLDL